MSSSRPAGRGKAAKASGASSSLVKGRATGRVTGKATSKKLSAYARSGGRSSEGAERAKARSRGVAATPDRSERADRAEPRARPVRKKTTGTKPRKATKPVASHQGGERLQKIMARAGIASRRKAEVLITEGRVFVNGVPVTELGARADAATDKIEVDGNVITSRGPRVYILLYKPTGTISAVSDPEGRPVVVDLITGVKQRIFPVGRLDYDAEGVLLLTNDGELTNKLIHPRARISKTYLVKVKGKPDQDAIRRLAEGVYLEDGRTLPARAKFVKAALENSWIELTVTEGRNHLVKRMCLKIGHPVAKIRRTDFAGIKLGALKPGEFRVLTKAEVEELKELKQTTIKARARGGRPLAKGRGKKD